MNKKIMVNKNIIFIVAYEIMVFTSFFDNIAFIKEYSTILNIFAMGLMLLGALQNKYEKKYIFLLILLGILILCITFITQDLMALKIYILISFIKIDNFNKFIKSDFNIRLIYYILVLTLCGLGVVDNNTIYRYENNIPTTARYSLGFSHPNLLGMVSLMLVFEYVYLIDFKIKCKNGIFLGILFFIIAVIADSRTSTYIFILFLILVFMMKKTKIFNLNVLQKIICKFPILLLIVTCVGIYIYNLNSEFLVGVDLNIWSRFHYMNYYIDIYGIDLLGNNVTWVKPLDNIYCYMLVNHGIIFMLLYVILHMNLFKRLFREKQIGLSIILVFILFFGFFESGMLLIALNPFFFLVNKKIEIKDDTTKLN